VIHLFIWWLLVQLLGLIAQQYTSIIFRNLSGKVYFLGKPWFFSYLPLLVRFC